MKPTPRLFTISGLHGEIGTDRRTWAKALAGVAPDGQVRGYDAWHIKTALDALGGGPPDGTGKLDPAAEKARLDRARAEIAELEIANQRASVVEIGEAADAVAVQYAEVRAAVLVLPVKITARLTPGMPRAEIQAIALEEVTVVLETLSSEADAHLQAAAEHHISGARLMSRAGNIDGSPVV